MSGFMRIVRALHTQAQTGRFDHAAFVSDTGLAVEDGDGGYHSIFHRFEEGGGGAAVHALREETTPNLADRVATGPNILRHVLIAEDRPFILGQVHETLVANDWNARPAQTIDEAMTRLEAGGFGVFLSFTHFGESDPFEILRRAQEIDPLLPVIFMGHEQDIETVMSWIRAGAANYLDMLSVKFFADLPEHLAKAAELYREAVEQKAHLENARTTIEDLRRVHAKLRAMRDNALAANKAKSAFLANMSHELRTPLNAILGYSEMLVEALEGTEDAEDARKIITAGTHLLSLINDILDLAKIESGQIKLNPQEFSLREVFNAVASTMQPLADQKGNQLKIDIDIDDDTVVTDQRYLKQCLINLVGNACKFTENGQITISLRESQKDKDQIVIAVEDSGIGMTEEELARIFGAFVQANDQTAEQFGGTGLGLAITNELVQFLGGHISVTSEKGKGTTFEISLPKGRA